LISLLFLGEGDLCFDLDGLLECYELPISCLEFTLGRWSRFCWIEAISTSEGAFDDFLAGKVRGSTSAVGVGFWLILIKGAAC